MCTQAPVFFGTVALTLISISDFGQFSWDSFRFRILLVGCTLHNVRLGSGASARCYYSFPTLNETTAAAQPEGQCPEEDARLQHTFIQIFDRPSKQAGSAAPSAPHRFTNLLTHSVSGHCPPPRCTVRFRFGRCTPLQPLINPDS